MRTLILIAATLVLIACNQTESQRVPTEAEKTLAEVKSAVLTSLKEPDSAKFGQFIQVGENHACIEVNARNSFGGYTGSKPFSVQRMDAKWVALTSMDFPFELCVMTMQKMSERETTKK